MNKDIEHCVLFYPTGIVHMRNLGLLKKQLPGFRFMVIVEPWMETKAPDAVSSIDKRDRVVVENNLLPQWIWEEKIELIFLSMAYPNPFRLQIVLDAANRCIPVIALEEVNQLALNDGIINHYFLPVDYLGVVSEIERKKFLELGIPGENIVLTGWPFFDEDMSQLKKREFNIRSQYKIREEIKCCLLVLGSLKEDDIVSLETRQVRQNILEIAANGLTEKFQLLIKPHPIEKEASIEHIRKMAPGAIILDPKYPIEPLIEQADVIVNRGNSQVALLALLKNKPVIITPVGMNTIFHGIIKEVIADTASQFHRIIVDYSWGRHQDYRRILSNHFPIDSKHALIKTAQLFNTAIREKCTGNMQDKKLYIAILYAFLDNMAAADAILSELPDKESVVLLKKLFHRTISLVEFINLQELFNGKMIRWHLQALFIRVLTQGKSKINLSMAMPLLKGFDGEVNPHYFMEDIINRIELEYRAGNREVAEKLLKKFQTEYSVFDYYAQAFDMIRFTCCKFGAGRFIRKFIWIIKNLNKPYTRKILKRKFMRSGKNI